MNLPDGIRIPPGRRSHPAGTLRPATHPTTAPGESIVSRFGWWTGQRRTTRSTGFPPLSPPSLGASGADLAQPQIARTMSALQPDRLRLPTLTTHTLCPNCNAFRVSFRNFLQKNAVQAGSLPRNCRQPGVESSPGRNGTPLFITEIMGQLLGNVGFWRGLVLACTPSLDPVVLL